MSSKKKSKIWTASSDATAGMMVGQNFSAMVADRNNFAIVSKNGVVLTGKSIVFNSLSDNIRHAGFFALMNDFARLVPSTIVTPQPAQMPFPPTQLAVTIQRDMAFTLALMNPII